MPHVGVPGTGEVPAGADLCIFYRSGVDLLQVALAYLQMGLEKGEACAWVTAPPIGEQEAACALDAVVPTATEHRAQGQLEIMSESSWFSRDGAFDPARMAQHWFALMHRLDQRRKTGIRVLRQYPSLGAALGEPLDACDRHIREAMPDPRRLALWAYPAADCTPDRMLKVMQCHTHILLPTRSRSWTLTTVST